MNGELAMKSRLLWIALLGAACATSGCDREKRHEKEKEEGGEKGALAVEKVERAVVSIYPTEGNQAKGTVRFMRLDGAMRVSVDVEGLEPKTEHAFHIHEFGDCTAPDGSSAGEHYNPGNAPHGLPSDPERHLGDLGNMTSDADGRAKFEKTVELPTEKGSIIGRSLIIHSESDKGTQPTGAAGDRIGCGVVGVTDGRKPS